MSIPRKPPQIHWPVPQRATSGSTQPKTAGADRTRSPLAAPTVFWPRAGREVSSPGKAALPRPAMPAGHQLQPKAADLSAPQAHRAQIPAVYWPHSAQKTLQAKTAAHFTPLRPYWPARDPAVIQRSELKVVTFDQHYKCDGGHILSFKETGANEHLEEECPLRCRETLRILPAKVSDSTIYYCANSKCKQFHISSNISGKCSECEKSKLQLSEQPAYLDETVEKTSSKAENQLKAQLRNAQDFVESSGTHHKSTGGSHTASATATHTDAHHGKMLVRERIAGNLEKSAAKVSNKKLKKKANQMIGKVKNK